MTPLLTRLILILLSAVLLLGCGGQMDLSHLTGRELMDLGMDRYANHKYLRAIDAFQAMIFNFPGETYVDTAQYYLALSYFGDKSYILGQVEFNRLLLNYPSSPFASQAQLMKAVCFFKSTPKHYGLDQTDLETSIQQFEDFLVDYPESEATDEARAYLAEAKARLARKTYENGVVYQRLRDYRAARIYFQQVIDNYTNSDFAPLATFQIADTYFQDKKWDEAHERFDNFRVIFSEHELAPKALLLACEAAFKGGKEAFEAGDMTLARTRFERYQTVCSEGEKHQEVQDFLDQISLAPIVEVDSTNVGS